MPNGTRLPMLTSIAVLTSPFGDSNAPKFGRTEPDSAHPRRETTAMMLNKTQFAMMAASGTQGGRVLRYTVDPSLTVKKIQVTAAQKHATDCTGFSALALLRAMMEHHSC